MIQHEMDLEKGILMVKPQGPLAAGDFAVLAREADAYIAAHGALNGLVICAKKFPGWVNFQGFRAHLRFVRDHHRNIKKVAFVSNSRILQIVTRFAKYVVQPEARYFKYKQEDEAREWMSKL